MAQLKIWWQAARPKTLGAAVAPVLIGTVLAIADGGFYAPAALCALLGAVFIQIGTNYSNDYLDFLRGADTDDRQGPTRATQAGLVTADAMKRATILAFVAAVLAGGYLIVRGGWPILAVGLLSIACGVLYTGGRYALAYTGMADLFVLIFFGPVAVGGTYYVQTLTLPPLVLLVGLAPGLISVGILLVNNLRDVAQDAEADKRTLIVRLGRRFGEISYGVCLVIPLVLPVGLYLAQQAPLGAMATLLLTPLAIRDVRRLVQAEAPPAYNPLLGATGRYLLVYSLVFSVGWLL